MCVRVCDATNKKKNRAATEVTNDQKRVDSPQKNCRVDLFNEITESGKIPNAWVNQTKDNAGTKSDPFAIRRALYQQEGVHLQRSGTNGSSENASEGREDSEHSTDFTWSIESWKSNKIQIVNIHRVNRQFVDGEGA